MVMLQILKLIIFYESLEIECFVSYQQMIVWSIYLFFFSSLEIMIQNCEIDFSWSEDS